MTLFVWKLASMAFVGNALKVISMPNLMSVSSQSCALCARQARYMAILAVRVAVNIILVNFTDSGLQ